MTIRPVVRYRYLGLDQSVGLTDWSRRPERSAAIVAKKHSTRSSTHPVDDVDSPHCTDFGRVVDEADVSLCGSVQLSDFNVPEAIQKLWPNVCSDPVADREPHSVVLLIVFLQRVTST